MLEFAAFAAGTAWLFKKFKKSPDDASTKAPDNDVLTFLADEGNAKIVDFVFEQTTDLSNKKNEIIRNLRIDYFDTYICVSNYNIWFQWRDRRYYRDLSQQKLYIISFVDIGKNPIGEKERKLFKKALLSKFQKVPWLKTDYKHNDAIPYEVEHFIIRSNGNIPETYGTGVTETNTELSKQNESIITPPASNAENTNPPTNQEPKRESERKALEYLKLYNEKSQNGVSDDTILAENYDENCKLIDLKYAEIIKSVYFERILEENIRSNVVRLKACMEVIESCNVLLQNPCHINSNALDEKISKEEYQHIEFDLSEEKRKEYDSLDAMCNSLNEIQNPLFDADMSIKLAALEFADICRTAYTSFAFSGKIEDTQLLILYLKYVRASDRFIKVPTFENKNKFDDIKDLVLDYENENNSNN